MDSSLFFLTCIQCTLKYNLFALLLIKADPLLNVKFQKISIPTPWKANGNSGGVGGGGEVTKVRNVIQKVWGLLPVFPEGWRVKTKNLLWEGNPGKN